MATLAFAGIGMIEDGKFHYLTDVATEHKNMLVKPPVIQDNSWLTWSPTVQADINVRPSVFSFYHLMAMEVLYA